MNEENKNKIKILFVDDEVNIIHGIKRMMYAYKNEWELFYATGGAEALELLEKVRVNIIITDMRMPGMNGAELLSIVEH